jgi:hypothetical protein
VTAYVYEQSGGRDFMKEVMTQIYLSEHGTDEQKATIAAKLLWVLPKKNAASID